MADFLLKYADTSGQVHSQVAQGTTAVEVRERYAKQGFLVYSVKPRSTGISLSGDIHIPGHKKKLNIEKFLIFNQQFVTLIRAGLPILKSLDLLAERLTDPKLTPYINGVREEVRRGVLLSEAFRQQSLFPKMYVTSVMAGESLSGALSHHPELFPPGMLALVAMSEQSGTLPDILSAIATERERALRLKQKAVDALTYPAFLLAAVACVLVFFIGFVLPQFSAVLTDMGTKADPTLLSLLHASTYVGAHRLEASLLGLMVLGILLVALRSAGRRAAWVGALVRLPVIRSIDDDYRTAAFCRNFGNLTGHGVSLTDAIDLVGRSVARPGTLQIWMRAREDVRQGRRVFDALAGTGDLSTVALRMLRIGEETGQMSALALRAADIFEMRVERRIEKAIGFVGPAAIIVVSLVIGGLIVSVMTALMSVNQLAG